MHKKETYQSIFICCCAIRFYLA